MVGLLSFLFLDDFEGNANQIPFYSKYLSPPQNTARFIGCQ